MKIVKRYLPYIVGGIILLLAVWLIFRKVPVLRPDPLRQYLKEQNDSLMREVIQTRERYISRSREVDSLLRIIDTIDQKIKVEKIYYEKRIPVYDTFSIDQIERYFSDRYPDAYR